MSEEHNVELNYTIDDDGVWLECTCGWLENIGHGASPQEAMRLTLEHAGDRTAEVRQLNDAIHELTLAETDDRLHVAFARRDYARQILAGVAKTLESELRDQDEAVQNHLLALGVPNLKLTDPPRTLYLDNRPYISIVERTEGEDTDAKHERAAAALRAAGLGEFVGTRCNLAGLVSHYREILKADGEEAAKERIKAELGEVVELGITTKARTRKAS